MKQPEFSYIKTTIETIRVKESIDEIIKLLESNSKVIRLTEYLRGRPVLIMVNHIVHVYTQ